MEPSKHIQPLLVKYQGQDRRPTKDSRTLPNSDKKSLSKWQTLRFQQDYRRAFQRGKESTTNPLHFTFTFTSIQGRHSPQRQNGAYNKIQNYTHKTENKRTVHDENKCVFNHVNIDLNCEVVVAYLMSIGSEFHALAAAM